MLQTVAQMLFIGHRKKSAKLLVTGHLDDNLEQNGSSSTLKLTGGGPKHPGMEWGCLEKEIDGLSTLLEGSLKMDMDSAYHEQSWNLKS
ncbi:hypothetical protein N7454_008672 [Penicillium verhagenii]|nr:hypothetical protein N7454_008672 [Penicillium verhagenii]